MTNSPSNNRSSLVHVGLALAGGIAIGAVAVAVVFASGTTATPTASSTSRLLVQPTKCPVAPGFTATKAANERADHCNQALLLQGIVIDSGVASAVVHVSSVENDSFVGPEMVVSVNVRVQGAPRAWDASAMAKLLASAANTDTTHVNITTLDGKLLFSAGKRT